MICRICDISPTRINPIATPRKYIANRRLVELLGLPSRGFGVRAIVPKV